MFKVKIGMLNKLYRKIIIVLLSKLKYDKEFMQYVTDYGLIALEEKFLQIDNQLFFEKLHDFALNGMNYGNGGFLDQSGEKWVMTYIKNKIRNKGNLILFDVGANIGTYSQALLSLFDDTNFHLYSFEPSKEAFKLLNVNIKDDRIKTINSGISSKTGQMTLFADFDGSALGSVYKRLLDHHRINMEKSEIIEVTTLDDYCSKNNINRIDLLKLDIEGNELEALRGAKDLLKNRCIQFIQFEFG